MFISDSDVMVSPFGRCNDTVGLGYNTPFGQLKFFIFYFKKKTNICLHFWLRNYDWVEPAVSYKWTGWVRLKLKTAGKPTTDHSRGISGIFPILIKENWRISTCNRLDLQTLGSQPVNICPKFSPILNPPEPIHSIDQKFFHSFPGWINAIQSSDGGSTKHYFILKYIPKILAHS